jgi:Glycosyltransferase
MIRILHVVHALTRGGGLSHFVMNYYRNIDREKIQFDFLYFKEVENDFKEEISMLGGEYYYMSMPSASIAFFKQSDSFFKQNSEKYTAIHCHALFAVSVFAPFAKKYGLKNIIAHSHSVGYGIGFIKKLRNLYFVKRAKRLSQYHLACSLEAAEFMFGKSEISENKVKIINNAIDINKYMYNGDLKEKIRNELGLKNKFIIGHVGGFVQLKNHSFLIDVFNEIVKINQNAHLILIGADGTTSDGSSKNKIVEKTHEYSLQDHIHFLGIRDNINELMMAMDIFIFPSLYEGLGLVLIEAQATGLLCYASDNVPKDSKLTDRIRYLSLKKTPFEWAEIILNDKLSNQNREMDINLFDKFNIETQKSVLENIYLEMNN